MNVTIELWFYKSQYGTYQDFLIALWTRSLYSHVELVLPSGCYSSSPRDGGVRFKTIAPSDHWDVIKLDISHEQLTSIEEWAVTQVGLPYDWLGIIGVGIGLSWLSTSDAWFCSRLIAHSFMVAGLMQDDWLTPQQLYNQLK